VMLLTCFSMVLLMLSVMEIRFQGLTRLLRALTMLCQIIVLCRSLIFCLLHAYRKEILPIIISDWESFTEAEKDKMSQVNEFFVAFIMWLVFQIKQRLV